ncbi:hypothetical protein BC833DRAFT_606994, partial [Globomyces pollinis-pini]
MESWWNDNYCWYKKLLFYCLAVTAYMILFADFGTENHMYAPIRRFYQSKKDQYFTLSAEEYNEFVLSKKPSS